MFKEFSRCGVFMSNFIAMKKKMIIFIIVLAIAFLVLFMVLFIRGPQHLVVPADDIVYSFFVAGHTYGSPGKNNYGLHPPFEKKISFIKNTTGMSFGVLTGDIVKESTAKDWDEVDRTLDRLDIPVYFAVGNHDIKDRDLYEKRYGKTYFSFNYGNDLFIVLDPNLDYWNISGQQMEFLRNTLKGADIFNRVFVFFHQVLWWELDNEYKDIMINSTEGRANKINFFSNVEPLFRRLKNEIYMFAGDVAATDEQLPTHDINGNIHLITSGMGRGKCDNFIIVTIDKNDQVKLNVIALNKLNPFAFGILE